MRHVHHKLQEFSAAPGLLLLSAYLLHDHALEIAAATDPFQRVSNEDEGGSHFAPYYRSLPVNHQMLPAQWPEQILSERIKGSFLERQLRAKRRSEKNGRVNNFGEVQLKLK